MIAKELKKVRKFITGNDKPKRYVGVISQSIKDFMNWKIENGFDKINPHNISRKFEIDNTIYICISNINHMRGYHLDEILETSNVYSNKQYDDIIDSCEPALKNLNK